MPALKKFLAFGLPPSSSDVGLLILRVGAGVTLFLRHGLGKLQHFNQMAAHFPNPIHIGSYESLLFATLSDGICSLLVALGLVTRLAALIVFINTFVVWSLVEHASFFGRNPGGELASLFWMINLAILFLGGGRFSIDHALASGSDRAPEAKAYTPKVNVS